MMMFPLHGLLMVMVMLAVNGQNDTSYTYTVSTTPVNHWKIDPFDARNFRKSRWNAVLHDSEGSSPLSSNSDVTPIFVSDRYGKADSAIHLVGIVSSWMPSGSVVNVDEFTVTMWLSPQQGANDTYGYRILSINSGNIIVLGANNGQFYVEFNINGYGGGDLWSNASSLIEAGQWYNLALSVSQSGIALYVNGVQETSVSFTASNNTYVLGGTSECYGTNGYTDGVSNEFIDDIQLFDSVLSADQIYDIYTAPEPAQANRSIEDVRVDSYYRLFGNSKQHNNLGGSLLGGATLYFEGENFDFYQNTLQAIITTYTYYTYNGYGSTTYAPLSNLVGECDIISQNASFLACVLPALPKGYYSFNLVMDGQALPASAYSWNFFPYINIISYSPFIISVTPSAIGEDASTLSIKINTGGSPCWSYRINLIGYYVSDCSYNIQDVISSVSIGGFPCNLGASDINFGNESASNLLRVIDHVTTFTCQLEVAYPGNHNVTVLTSFNGYATSVFQRISPDNTPYQVQYYPIIDSLSQQLASAGQPNAIVINGRNLISSDSSPVNVTIGSQPCNVLLVDQCDSSSSESKIFCFLPSGVVPSSQEYVGNRGLNISIDYVYTPLSSGALLNANPSSIHESWVIGSAYFDPEVLSYDNDSTVWLSGFLTVKVTSTYEISLVTNGEALLYFSNNNSSANKALLISTNQAIPKASRNLTQNQFYYFLIVASKKGSGFNLSMNAKMYNSNLVVTQGFDLASEIQQIQETNKLSPESFSLSYPSIKVKPTSEVQRVVIPVSSDASQPFVLSFGSVSTIALPLNSSASDVQKALNDIPTLSPNYVIQVNLTVNSSSRTYTVVFHPDLGDVTLLSFLSGYASGNVIESVKGVASGNRVQLVIQKVSTQLLSLNDSSQNIQALLSQSFGVRCPTSLLNDSTILWSMEWSNTDNLTSPSFCGSGSLSLPNSIYEYNLPFIGRYLCFAYLLNSYNNSQYNYIYVGLNYWSYWLYNPLTTMVADNQWHYSCIDLVALFIEKYPELYSADINSFTINYFGFYSQSNGYIDTLSVRTATPPGYSDDDTLIINSRRLFPPFSIDPSSLNVSNSAGVLSISYQPLNVANLSIIAVQQTFATNRIKISRTSKANALLSGTFSLSLGNSNLLDIPWNISANDLANKLQSALNFAAVVNRTGNSTVGYSYLIESLTAQRNLLNIKSNNLVGNKPTVVLSEIQTGGAVFQPIPDALLRTVHSKQQLTVSVNGVAAKCLGSCDFQFYNPSTPIVNSVNIASNYTIQLIGSGFSNSWNVNTVSFGSSQCKVLSISTTKILCSVISTSQLSGKFQLSLFVGKVRAIFACDDTVQF